MEYHSAMRKKEILPCLKTWLDLEGIVLNEINKILCKIMLYEIMQVITIYNYMIYWIRILHVWWSYITIYGIVCSLIYSYKVLTSWRQVQGWLRWECRKCLWRLPRIRCSIAPVSTSQVSLPWRLHVSECQLLICTEVVTQNGIKGVISTYYVPFNSHSQLSET